MTKTNMNPDQWQEYCELMQREIDDEIAYENDMLMRQWEDMEDYYNA